MESFSEYNPNNNNEKNSIKKFEQFLNDGKSCFFDLEVFEIIIDHYLEIGSLKKALLACELGIDQHPYSGDLYLDLAQVYLNSEKFEKTLDALDQAEAFLPGDPEIQFVRGSAYICLEEYQKGILAIEEVINRLEDSSTAYMQVGMAYLALDESAKAIESFKEALINNFNNEDALYELSECLDILGKLEEALPFFESCIDNDPYSATAWFNLGVVYDKLNKSDEAINAYDYAIIIDEKFASAYFNLAVTKLNQGEVGEALKLFKQTRDLEQDEPDSMLFLYLGQCYQRLNDHESAVKHFQESTKLNQNNDAAWYGIGNSLDTQERWLESIHFFKKACDIAPSKTVYVIALANAEYQTGNIFGAAQAFEKAIELEPKNVEVWKDWSYLFYENGDLDKACKLINMGLEEVPDDAGMIYRHVSYLIKQRNYQEAFNNLENALILDFEKHTELLEFFTDIETQKGIMKVIDQLKK